MGLPPQLNTYVCDLPPFQKLQPLNLMRQIPNFFGEVPTSGAYARGESGACAPPEGLAGINFLVHNIFVAQKLWIWRNTNTLRQNSKLVSLQFVYILMYFLNFRVNRGNMLEKILLDGQKKIMIRNRL